MTRSQELHISFIHYRGGGGSPDSKPYMMAEKKVSVFGNGQFSGHLFFSKKVDPKCRAERFSQKNPKKTTSALKCEFFEKKQRLKNVPP